MSKVGWVLVYLGALVCVVAVFMNVTVDAPGMTYADPSVIAGKVANYDLMAQRLGYIIIGSAISLSGWACLILSALRQNRVPPAA